MRHYAVGCAMNLDLMLLNLDKSKLHLTSAICEEMIGDRHFNSMIKKICMEGLKLVVDDIIENNVTFVLPTGTFRPTQIRMNRFTGNDFIRARKAGKFANVDFLASNFSGNELVFETFYKDGRPFKKKPIYVDGKRKARITQRTNEGVQYY